jgi:hypothetical protein
MTPVEVFGDTCARDYGVDATNLYSQTISRATPRAYYRLQEQSNGGAIPDGAYAHDWLASSSQTVGTFHGNVRGGAEGALRCGPDNFAVTFDADGSSPGRVTLQTLNSVGDFTIEGWSYLTEGTNGGPMNPNGNATLFGAYGSERLLIRPRGVYGDIMIGGVKYIVETTLPSNTGGWHYWAFVRSGNTLTLYRDAKAVGSRTGVPTSTIPLRGNIGEQTNGTYPFQGALDEIALYTRAVPASEVSEHYNAATPQAPPDTAG